MNSARMLHYISRMLNRVNLARKARISNMFDHQRQDNLKPIKTFFLIFSNRYMLCMRYVALSNNKLQCSR